MAKRALSIDDLDSINGGFLPLLALGAAYLGPTATVALVGVGTAAALNPAATVQTLTNTVQHVHDAYNWLTSGSPEPSAYNPMGDYTGVPTPTPTAPSHDAPAPTQLSSPNDNAPMVNQAPVAEPPADTGDFSSPSDAPTQLADATTPGDSSDSDVG